MIVAEYKIILENDESDAENIFTEGTKYRYGNMKNFWSYKLSEEKQTFILVTDLGWEKNVTGFYLRNHFMGEVG